MKPGITLLLVSLLLLGACKKDSQSQSYTPTCDGSVKSYNADVSPLINNYCGGCHQNFTSNNQLFANSSMVRSMIASGQMPQGSTLTITQKNTIICCIDNGALNN